MRRVVVTGMGAMTPFGNGVGILWDNVLQGKSAVKRIERFLVKDFPVKAAGEIPLENVQQALQELSTDERKILGTNPCTIYAYLALREALLDAGFDLATLPDMGLILGVGHSHGNFLDLYPEMLHCFTVEGVFAEEAFLQKLLERPELYALYDDYVCGLGPGRALFQIFHFTEPILNISTACASGTNALGEALRKIRHGASEIIVAGGVESLVDLDGLTLFQKLHILATSDLPPEQVMRPFDATREGFVLGEGAGIVVLEEMDHAIKRGARIYAELAGYASGTDIYHVTSPTPSGEPVARVMCEAMQDAGVAPEEIGYINAHGTATEYNDAVETTAIKLAFGDRASRVPISSTKSELGHMIAASGAIELILSVLAVREGLIPPTINYEHFDPACDLNYVPGGAERADVPVALSNSVGFGGQNAMLIVKKMDLRREGAGEYAGSGGN